MCMQSRGVLLVGDDRREDGDDELSVADPFCLLGPHPYGNGVSLSADGCLTWPVLLLYPEYGQSDFIESFHEDSRCVFACVCVCMCVCVCVHVCVCVCECMGALVCTCVYCMLI